MKRERDLLHDLVFPKVKAHCKTLEEYLGTLLNSILYIPKNKIKSFELDTSSYFGANINLNFSKDFWLGEKHSLGFFSDDSATTFYEEMKKLHDSDDGK